MPWPLGRPDLSMSSFYLSECLELRCLTTDLRLLAQIPFGSTTGIAAPFYLGRLSALKPTSLHLSWWTAKGQKETSWLPKSVWENPRKFPRQGASPQSPTSEAEHKAASVPKLKSS